MKHLETILILIIIVLLIVILWLNFCESQEPQPIVEELLEEVSDLEKDIAYAVWNKKRLTYTIWIIRDVMKAHVKEAKGYGTAGSFHHWSEKYKHNPKINLSEEP